MNQGEWCWISADGHLESGAERDLLRAFAEGRIPEDNPVWCPAANSWSTLREVVQREEEPAPVAAEEDSIALPPSTQSDLQPCYVADEGERLSFVPTTVMPVVEAPAIAPPPASVRPLVQTIAPPPPALPPRPTPLLPALVGGGLLLFGSVVAFALVAHAWISPKRSHAARALGTELGAPSLKRAQSSAGCRLTTPARRLAPLVVPGGPLSLASFGSQIAIGATVNTTTGIGLTLSPKDLSVHETEWITDPVSLSAVVPTSNDTFSVDRWTRSVPGTSAFSVGMMPHGFSRVDASGAEQHVIWPGRAQDPITRPSIVPLPNGGWAVAFRQADGASSVRLGYIDAQGRATGELASFAPNAERASAPSLAISDGRLGLTFAERRSGGAWWVVVGASAVGRVPAANELRLIAEDGQAPAIAAASSGRWLLAWAADGKLQARVLDPKLGRVASVLTIAELPEGGGAPPSIAIWSNGSRAAIAFTKDLGNWRGELWAAGLECQ